VADRWAEWVVVAPTLREARELALRACAVFNLDVGRVDIMSSRRGSAVSEVNISPEFGGIESLHRGRTSPATFTSTR